MDHQAMAVRAGRPQAVHDVPKRATVNERSDARRGRQLVDLPLLNLPPHLQPVAGLIALLLVGALLGAAGFAATVHRRQIRRIARLTERLAMGADPAELTVGRQIRDPGLRATFEQLASRIEQTWTLATQDYLTEVANRQALLTRLDEEIERASRYGHQLSIAMIDIDHFKRLNDTHGHLAGDLVLHRIAQTIQGSIRRVDVVGRYGGEEFMVILPETDVDAAASIAEKVRRLVGRAEVRLADGTVVAVTLSAGVAGGAGAHLRLDALVRDADAALYSAKSFGRDQVYVFHEVEDDRRVRRAAIAPAAREAAIEVGRAAMVAGTDALAEVLRQRPGWAGGPSTMIAESAAAVAEALGLPAGEIDRIRTASLLHDLGKLAIPDEILAKPGDLDESEWRVVTEHPKIGQVVLEQAGALRDAATIVLHHHEWYDGRGYPHGLTGQQIPVGARIVAVADAYEAMVSGRPYRTAISHEGALQELRRHAGLQFDPEIVEQFVSLFAEGVSWKASADHGHDHPHPHPRRIGRRRDHAAGDAGDHAAIHDALHARRLRTAALDLDDPDAEALPDVAPARARASRAKLRTGTTG
jgi:diguanylate cyclase (GGDEF)-like protein